MDTVQKRLFVPWLVGGARVDWARWEMAEGDGKPQPRGVWGPSIEDARLLGTTGRDVDEEAEGCLNREGVRVHRERSGGISG